MPAHMPLTPFAKGSRKLQPADVIAARRMAADGMPASQIAAYFPSVATETLRRAIRGETHREVTAEPAVPAGGGLAGETRQLIREAQLAAEAGSLSQEELEGEAVLRRLQGEIHRRLEPGRILEEFMQHGQAGMAEKLRQATRSDAEGEAGEGGQPPEERV